MIYLLKVSMTITNKEGNIKSPWCNPRLLLKKLWVNWCTAHQNRKLTVDIQNSIYFLHLSPNPHCSSNTKGIPVYMVISLLHINFTQHPSYPWIHTTIQAFICYENWFQHLPPLDDRVLHNTLSHNTPFNLFTNTFASNLYIIPTRLIGLTSFTSRTRGHTIIQFST